MKPLFSDVGADFTSSCSALTAHPELAENIENTFLLLNVCMSTRWKYGFKIDTLGPIFEHGGGPQPALAVTFPCHFG